jgi:predicted transcriptional regulator
MEMSAMEYEDSLAHYGILRKSGRYPWGSGKNPNQRSKSFLDILEEHKKDGLSEAEIAKLYHTKEHPFTVSDLRAAKSHSVTLQKQDQIREAQRLKDKGMGASAIARQMGVNESTVRSLLEPGRLDRLDTLQKTADMLKRQVDEKGMIDVGAHVERDLPLGDNPETKIGISKDKFNTALSMLKEEGYQVVTDKATRWAPEKRPRTRHCSSQARVRQNRGIGHYLNRENLRLISEKTTDGGHSYEELAFKKPLNIDPKRVAVRYKEDGGADADGVIYVRPGVKDISLGKAQYAQVRIAVGGTHYLKGMAVYKNDLPDGVDLMFNTNKSKTGNKLDALKPLKKDKDGNVDWKNPFGSFPKPGGQILGADGKPSSAMNILTEQGDWHTWSRNLSRQVLSKQSPDLAKSQLDLTYDRRRQEFEEIRKLTNPLIKRRCLSRSVTKSILLECISRQPICLVKRQRFFCRSHR